MEKSEMLKKIDEYDLIVKKAISYMEKNPSPYWTDERRKIADGAKRARQERDRLVSELEKGEVKN